jgi:hypothetical protein
MAFFTEIEKHLKICMKSQDPFLPLAKTILNKKNKTGSIIFKFPIILESYTIYIFSYGYTYTYMHILSDIYKYYSVFKN